MDRLSLQQMLRAALSPAKPFDVILVDDTSRLSRSTESVLSIYRKLNFAGLQLISVSQGIDSRQDQADCESAVLRGLHVGGSCFGYSTAPVGEPGTGSKRLVIDETQAKIVRRIFEMSAIGYSLKPSRENSTRNRLPGAATGAQPGYAQCSSASSTRGSSSGTV